ncbi:MAG TPA: CAP domain-containing protein [Prolixibacteraceae bacterium]|nr:CAP domain-containing protein [Prolixibacteraceae bacterium]
MKTTKTFILFIILLLAKASFAQSAFEWPVKELDTAREVTYLSNEEKDMILEMNKVRYNPTMYAQKEMKWMGQHFEGKILKIPGEENLLTSEGKNAYEECIKYLETAKPAPLLYPSKGMTKACRLLVYDQEVTGATGHRGSGNSTPSERVKKFGTFMGNFAENLHYGNSSASFAMIYLLIDDGEKSRGHRLAILNPSFNNVGVAIGKHKTYSKMFVSNFATHFTEK